jgi:signal peptidase II
MKLTRGKLAALIIVLVIVLDQVVKIWVKTSFYLGEDFEILPFLHLHFIQNNGMAFGMELGSKLFLTLFRIVAVSWLIWYLNRIRKDSRIPLGYLICVAMVAAGAAGNIFDCVFYGKIFTNPWPPMCATFVPWGQGYGELFHGLVVDMIYCPLFSIEWPAWLPLIGGKTFSFFDPVFNIADAAISVGMIAILVFYSKCISMYSEKDSAEQTEKEHSDNA